MSEGKNSKKFLILTGGRTGSTAIVKWLQSSPLIRCHNEVFLAYHNTAIDSFGYYVSKTEGRPFLYKYGLHWRIAGIEGNPISVKVVNDFMDKLYYDPEFSAPWEKLSDKETYTSNVNFNKEKLVGFKIGYIQYNALYGVRNWLKENDVYVIQLFRKNLLKKHVSKMMADATSVWHSQDKVNNKKLTLDIGHALKRIKITEEKDQAMTKKLKESGKKLLQINYEDFLNASNRSKFSAEFASFFDEEKMLFDDLETSLKKLNSNRLEDLLENYDEVHKAFSQTEYAKFLIED